MNTPAPIQLIEAVLFARQYTLQDIKKLSISATEPFIVLDEQQRIKVFNQAACDKYQVKYEEVIGKLLDFIDESDFNKSPISVNTIQAGGVVSPAQHTLLIAKER